MALLSSATTRTHLVTWTYHVFILAVRVISGPIVTAIQFVNRLVIAVWIMIHGKSFQEEPINQQETHTTPREHSHITRVEAAMDSCFVLIRTHQHGIAPGERSHLRSQTLPFTADRASAQALLY